MSLIFRMAKIGDYGCFILPGPDKWNQKAVNSWVAVETKHKSSSRCFPLKVKAWMKYTYAEEVAAFYTALKGYFTQKFKLSHKLLTLKPS